MATHSQEQPLHQEGVESSHSMGLHSNPFVHDLCLPKVDVNKFDGSDPTGWVTQMEHYFSLHGITNDLMKLCVNVLYLYPSTGNGGNGVRIPTEVIFLGLNLSQIFMSVLKHILIIWAT
jgi:hypothetical protein